MRSTCFVIFRLQKHLSPNGRLYFIGMNPIPDIKDKNHPGYVISEVRQARDACILLAGHRCYREFPYDWMVRHIEGSGMKIVDSKKYTKVHSEISVIRQIKVAQSKLYLMQFNPLKSGKL